MVLAKSTSKVAKKPARSKRSADDESEEDTDDGEASGVLSDGSGDEAPDRFAATMQKQGSKAADSLSDEKPMKGARAMKGKKRTEGGASDEEAAEPPARELSKKELAVAKKAEAKALQMQQKEHDKAKVALKKAAAALKNAAAKNKKAEATAKGVCKKQDAKLTQLAKLRAAAQKVRDAATSAADNSRDQHADAEWALNTATMRVDETAPPKRAMKERVEKAMKGGAMKKVAKGAKKPGMKSSMKAMKVAMKAMKGKRR